MKKVIALSAAFILAAASCSSGKNIEQGLNENGKSIVTVGYYGENDPLLCDEGRVPENIEAVGVDLCGGDGFDPLDVKQQQALRLELDKAFAKGDVPDILLLGVEDVMRLDRVGALADLSALMDGYDGIKRDDLTDAALAGLTVDGRIPALMKSYSVFVPTVRSELVPQEYDNWTAEDAMGFYVDMPEDMAFCGGMDMGAYMIRLEGMNCVDVGNGTCDFSGKFADILRFCQENYEKVGDDAENMVCFTRWGDSIAQSVYSSFYGQDVTFAGFPSEDGCGAEVSCRDRYLYCITEKCADKKAAWELLCAMVRANYDSDGRYIERPLEISVFREWIKDDYDEFIAGVDPDMPEEVIVTRAYFDRVYAYYNSVPANIYRDYELQWMILEECEPVFAGERSVEDAVRILNNRVGLYLSETS